MAKIDLLSDLKIMVEQELSNLGYSNSITADLDTVLLLLLLILSRELKTLFAKQSLVKI